MEDKLIVKFDGELNQVDARTLINSLACVVTIVDEISSEISTTHKIDVKVNPLKKGSFIIDFQFIAQIIENAGTLITTDNVQVLTEIIIAITSMFKLRQFLKGDRPKGKIIEGENISIKNSDNVSITINKNIYDTYEKNQNINEALDNHFEAIHDDKAIESFELYNDESESVLKVGRDEFNNLSTHELAEEIQDDTQFIRLRANLIMFKIVFDEKHKWEFIHRSRNIRAFIKDEEFYKRINNGEKFSKGDILVVELEITRVLDKSVNVYIDKEFNVLKVYDHIEKEKQIDLEF